MQIDVGNWLGERDGGTLKTRLTSAPCASGAASVPVDGIMRAFDRANLVSNAVRIPNAPRRVDPSSLTMCEPHRSSSSKLWRTQHTHREKGGVKPWPYNSISLDWFFQWRVTRLR